MITKAGQTVRCAVQNIRETSRGSKGVKLVNLGPRDLLVGISEVVELDEDTVDEVDNPQDNSLDENTVQKEVKSQDDNQDEQNSSGIISESD